MKNKSSIKKLSDEESKELIAKFREQLGRKIFNKRVKLGLTQDELADSLSISRTSLSKYEYGLTDFKISKLPLISLYLDIPINNLFSKEEYGEIMDTFKTAVSITVERRRKQPNHDMKPKASIEKRLKAQIYEVDGEDVIEPVLPSAEIVSQKEMYKSAELHTQMEAFTEEEFCEYIMQAKEKDLESILEAGKLLKLIKNEPSQKKLRNALADFIIDEFIIENVIRRKPNESHLKAYEYYFILYNKYKNPNWNPNWDKLEE